ncbi:MAG TPA: DUF2007 domain-containing protein [Spirochaetales bacterium]|nr:DUF2007 domain-containing protein [Spirochaetales bacterium]HPS14775.1 DUF2007 domain-containing protein [Spirochaetales bacterium]
MKTVFAAAFQEDAIVVKSLLESAEIPAEMMTDSMLDVNPFYSINVKGVSVLVPDEYAQDALAIVRDFEERKKAEKTEEEREDSDN